MSDRGVTPDGATTDPRDPSLTSTSTSTRTSAHARNTGKPRKEALSLSEASAGMHVRKLSVRAPDVVFVKGIIEASEGIAMVFAERGGDLTIAAPEGRGAELAELLEDIASEVSGHLTAEEPALDPEAPSGDHGGFQ